MDSLPRLVWCASLKKGEDVAVVYAGPWVETGKNCFFEGAWDRPFQEYRFDRARVFAGSGGRICQDRILFSTPTHPTDCLYSLHLGNRLLVSNSAVFLLVQADDSPDIFYPFYINDLVRLHQMGFCKKPKRIRTGKGNCISFHFSCNILVNQDLSLSSQEKDASRSPSDFNEYTELLERTLKAVAQNASDPLREHPYELLTTISKGYDSTASSVLARRAGCKEAVTFAPIDSEETAPDDSGKAIGERLGLKVTEYDFYGFKRLPGLPEAEFAACSNGMDVAISIWENQLIGKLLVTGRPGDLIWSKWRVKALVSRFEPTNLYGAGTSLNEFRLRVGFLHCPILYLTARDSLSIFRITLSSEMKPWSIGGSYDRPIARRIVESAGIPRSWFGQKKMANAYVHIWKTKSLSKRSRSDFFDFYNREIPQMSVLIWSKYILLLGVYLINQILSLSFKRIAGFLKLPRYVLPDVVRPSNFLFTFHWGFFRIKDRYRIDPNLASLRQKNQDKTEDFSKQVMPGPTKQGAKSGTSTV